MPAIMNQYPDAQPFSLSPDSSPAALVATLATLLIPGDITDSRLEAYCRRLQERFDLFMSTCPAPEWSSGLILTPEIRCQSEIYLPLTEIQAAFRYLLRRSCRYRPFLPAVPLFSSLTLFDALEQLNTPVFTGNPARTLARIASDQTLRTELLAALFVPKRYGGGFDRYPRQKRFLLEWLSLQTKDHLTVLDAACGSGEGVYELAGLAAEAGFQPAATTLHGCTVEPLELAAAAHGWFPHDAARERAIKEMITASSRQQWAGSIQFFREDICTPRDSSGRYDVVICNGLLGGPLLYERNTLETAVKGLVKRLKKKGIFLAADRFHGGWRRKIPLNELGLLCTQHGLRLLDLPEGIGGIRI
jgi:chemotaxis methyl-accepting protein methylase